MRSFRKPRSVEQSELSEVDGGAALTSSPWLELAAQAGCNICGQARSIIVRPDESQVEDHSTLRESLRCRSCGSISRDRALLLLLAGVLGERGPVSSWPPRTAMRLMETSGYRGHPPFLAELFDYYNLQYAPPPKKEGGEAIDARRGGDLQDLQFPSDFFDLVMTAEVLEHVADEQAAIREIARVVAPGGHLVLETPYDHASERTAVLVHRWHGRDVYLHPPQYHDEDTLVYRIYGRELLAQLADAGLAVGHLVLDIPQLAITPQSVIVARKGPYLDLAGFRIDSWFQPSG